MADPEISVKISADVKSLLQGMKDAQESTSTATEGMQGNLGALIESFEKMGMATVAIGAVGIAFEGLKKAFEYIGEAIEKTYELAESFKVLSYATGASLEEMNHYTAAIELSGGSTENLEGLLRGMQRGIKANSDVLIANGVASDKAALQGMSFVEYVTKVKEIAESMATPTERMQFLILALGRSGAMAGEQLSEFVENLKKTEGVVIISPATLAQLDESKQAIGRLKIAQQEYAAQVSASSTPIANWFRNLKAGVLESEIELAAINKLMGEHLIQAQFTADGVSLDYKKMAAAAKEYFDSIKGDMGREQMHAKTAEDASGEPKKKLVDKADLQAQQAAAKQAHDEKIAMGNAAAMEELKIAKWEAEEAQKVNADQLKRGEITIEEYTASAQASAQKVYEAEQAASSKKITLAEGDKAKIQAIDFELAAAKRTLNAAGQALDEKAKTHAVELERELTEECLKLNKEYHKKKEAQDKAAEAITQKTEKETEKKFEEVITAMTNGWDVGIQKMLHGHMSLKDGAINALKQIEDQTEKTVINMGIQWLKDSALKQALALKDHFVANQEAAGTAAGNAWASAAEIPMVGWIIAPVAAAAAYAGVMAFAEGGWDRVPSDQVAMIHKNEMVLPAHIAEPVRQMAARGGGGGDVHFHGTSAGGFFIAHQSELIAALRSANRNGRIG